MTQCFSQEVLNFPAEHFASAGAVAYSPMQQTLPVAAVFWEMSVFSKRMQSCVCVAEDRLP